MNRHFVCPGKVLKEFTLKLSEVASWISKTLTLVKKLSCCNLIRKLLRQSLSSVLQNFPNSSISEHL